MGYFIASCAAVFSVLGVYGLIVLVRIRRRSARVSERGSAARD